MQQWTRQVGKILTCNTKVLEIFARREYFHPLAFLEKQFPLNWIEKCKMTLSVWITATGWLPKQSTTVNKVGNIIIAAISDHRERIVAASRKSRIFIVFKENKFLIFPAPESHRRELMGLRRAFKKRWSWVCNPVCMGKISALFCVAESIQGWHTWVLCADRVPVSAACQQILMDSSEALHKHGRSCFAVSHTIRARMKIKSLPVSLSCKTLCWSLIILTVSGILRGIFYLFFTDRHLKYLEIIEYLDRILIYAKHTGIYKTFLNV